LPLAGAGTFAKQPGRLRFQSFPHGAEAADVLGCGNAHTGAHAAAAFHEHLLLQPLQSLTDRQHTHVQTGSQIPAGNLSPHLQSPPQNLIEDELVRGVGQVDVPALWFMGARALRRHGDSVAELRIDISLLIFVMTD